MNPGDTVPYLTREPQDTGPHVISRDTAMPKVVIPARTTTNLFYMRDADSGDMVDLCKTVSTSGANQQFRV